MQYGEIVQLGRHRLMCGDATKYEDIEALLGGDRVNLVLTDPPYGINIVRSGTNMKRYTDILNDTSTDTARKHYTFIQHMPAIIWGGNYFTDFLPVNKCWLVWDKHHSPKNYNDGELAWTNLNRTMKIYHHHWNGFVREGSTKLNPRPRVHPTQKPVELHMQILEDFTQPDDVILDCFGGSGTTLIACQLTGRTCYMMDISPDYCDIITKRYQTLTEGMISYA